MMRLTIFFSLFLLTCCASRIPTTLEAQPDRLKVRGNFNVDVVLGDDFQFLSSAEDSTMRGGNRFELKSYTYGVAEDGTIKRMVTVELVHALHSHFRDDFDSSADYMIREGEVTIGGQTYQQHINLVNISPDTYANQALADAGYHFPEGQMLEMMVGRVNKSRGRHLMMVFYLESPGQCFAGWTHPEELSQQQEECLQQFERNRGEAFQIFSMTP